MKWNSISGGFVKKSVPNFHFTEFPFLNEILSKSDPQFPFSVKRSIREKSKNIWEQFVAIWSLHFWKFKFSIFRIFKYSFQVFRKLLSAKKGNDQRELQSEATFHFPTCLANSPQISILPNFHFWWNLGFVNFRANFHFIELPFYRESTVVV